MEKIQLICDSNIAIIRKLLTNYEGKVFTENIIYKKTAIQFKRRYKINLLGVPFIFVQNGTMYKLFYNTYTWKGRVTEKAEYLPFVNVKDKFKRLENKIIVN